ncbi:MAG: hypothetical protein WAZ94_09190 [Phycisphaerales bacterium]
MDSWIARALARKKPRERMKGSMSAGEAPAKSVGLLKRAKSAGVALLTATSVHWAERMVAMRSSWGAEWVSSQWASG